MLSLAEQKQKSMNLENQFLIYQMQRGFRI
nr:MAG TPA: hypothetical protein [Caudoviricetes sp.]